MPNIYSKKQSTQQWLPHLKHKKGHPKNGRITTESDGLKYENTVLKSGEKTIMTDGMPITKNLQKNAIKDATIGNR